MPKPPTAQRPHPQIVASAWALPALAVLVLLAYSNSFSAGFVFDNRAILLEDPRLRALSAQNLALIISKPYWWPIAETSLYRPLTTFSYLINYNVFGNATSSTGYHVVNWLLHTLNVWLLFAIAFAITRRQGLAFFTAALWGVHPLGTEAVTNIVGRADLLAAFGTLLAFYAHLRARESPPAAGWRWTALSAVAIGLGVFSKESAVAGIAVIVLYDLLWDGDAELSTLARRWFLVATPVLLFLIQRMIVLRQSPPASFPYVDNPILGAGFWRGRLTAIAVIGRYLGLLVWPAHLSPDYSFAQIRLATGTPGEFVAWASVAIVAGLAILAARRDRQSLFWLSCAFIALLPGANLLFVTGTVMAERLMYLPSAFLIAAACGVIDAVASRVGSRRMAPALLSLLVLVAAGRAFTRNFDWHDDLTLWNAAVSAAPLSFKTHDALADALYDADPTHANLDQVVAEKEKSLEILKNVPDPAAISRPYRVAAAYYLERGDWLRDHRADPANVSASYRRAATLGQRYLELIAERPVSAKEKSDAELLVSTAAAHLDDRDTALTMAQGAAAAAPLNPMAYRASATALLAAGRLDDAALALMTGFILTGNQDLRSALVDIYRSGLDERRCATLTNGNGVVLNVQCEIVRRHLCAAAERAMQIQRAAGHPELAAQVTAFTADAHCADR